MRGKQIHPDQLTHAAHTPGPWHAGWSHPNAKTGRGITGPRAAQMLAWENKLPIVVVEGSGYSAPVAAVHEDAPDADANAHLIAAAPDMKDALTKARRVIGTDLSLLCLPGETDRECLNRSVHEAIAAIDAAIAKAEGRS